MVPFSPLDLTPKLWLDAADTSTITSSSGNVSQWNDKSGSGWHVSQATGTAQPNTGTVTQNGRNVIDFNGSTDYLFRNTVGIGRNVTGMTVYIVAKHDSQTDNSTPIAASNSLSFSTNRFFIFLAGNSGGSGAAYNAQGRTLDSDSAIQITSTLGTYENVWATQTVVYDYANTDVNQYVNGTLNGSNTAFQTATTTSNTDSLRLVVGVNHNLAAVSYMDGQIAEILVYHSAHTASQRALVLDYLNGKWGI